LPPCFEPRESGIGSIPGRGCHFGKPQGWLRVGLDRGFKAECSAHSIPWQQNACIFLQFRVWTQIVYKSWHIKQCALAHPSLVTKLQFPSPANVPIAEHNAPILRIMPRVFLCPPIPCHVIAISLTHPRPSRSQGVYPQRTSLVPSGYQVGTLHCTGITSCTCRNRSCTVGRLVKLPSIGKLSRCTSIVSCSTSMSQGVYPQSTSLVPSGYQAGTLHCTLTVSRHAHVAIAFVLSIGS
jgi:hypothetical protein